MKKIFLLLFLISLGFYSCEDQEENLAKDCMGNSLLLEKWKQ